VTAPQRDERSGAHTETPEKTLRRPIRLRIREGRPGPLTCRRKHNRANRETGSTYTRC
jgi:hypothetical protein